MSLLLFYRKKLRTRRKKKKNQKKWCTNFEVLYLGGVNFSFSYKIILKLASMKIRVVLMLKRLLYLML